MQQLEIEVLYNLRCEAADTMYSLRDIVVYLAKRVGASTRPNLPSTSVRPDFDSTTASPLAEGISTVQKLSQEAF